MEPVDIFGRIHRHQDFLGIDLRGQRQLNEDAVNLIAPVQVVNQLEQFLG